MPTPSILEGVGDILGGPPRPGTEIGARVSLRGTSFALSLSSTVPFSSTGLTFVGLIPLIPHSRKADFPQESPRVCPWRFELACECACECECDTVWDDTVPVVPEVRSNVVCSRTWTRWLPKSVLAAKKSNPPGSLSLTPLLDAFFSDFDRLRECARDTEFPNPCFARACHCSRWRVNSSPSSRTL